MTTNDEILTVANQLANQGKKPSVALVKTRLSQPTPLPQIISVLKTWQHDPEFTQVDKLEQPNINENDDQNTHLKQLIAEAIKPLEIEIAELKTLIKQLIDSR